MEGGRVEGQPTNGHIWVLLDRSSVTHVPIFAKEFGKLCVMLSAKE